MPRVLLALLVALAGCAPGQWSDVPERRAPGIAMPEMKSFSARRAAPSIRSNAQIARDFLDLSFQMESGRPIPILTRFRGPVKVAVAGTAPASLDKDLAELISRLRQEARIDISRAAPGEAAQITIETVPQRQLQRAVPQAACFVVPNVSGWSEFKRNRSRETTDWTKLTERSSATVIIPSDVSPQEVRDCLHEEIAQALGPLNDLYRLPDSIFNDDNFHTVLTGFDMLILRAYYSRELPNGTTREEAARVLPRLLDRLNPRGRSSAIEYLSSTPPEWNDAISRALSTRSSDTRRIAYAAKAVRIAETLGWRDNRLAFSLFVQGRVTLGVNSDTAITSFLQAGAIYKALYNNSVHTAHVATQMSAFALSSGQYDTAIAIVNDSLPATRASENAALLSTLLMIKAEALEAANRGQEAAIVRVDSLAWGQYGFGSEQKVRARLSEIRALAQTST
ncbi:MAG: DUF2927 domain-containing protein [Paracoccaceae bacterium]